ncbi:dynein light chain Tctex-type protein 2B [Hydra vulgaris]|uniref:dynein light chain Tctex-type protein 2B n=1 Tax=Hydra vulgaris TaxID=6087 RepID=UPI00064166CF|nr:dynein light chain Tctex-type protein 2B [Hydra vulgaris]
MEKTCNRHFYTLPELDIKITYNKETCHDFISQTLETESKEIRKVRTSSFFKLQDQDTSKTLTKNVDVGKFIIAHRDVPKKLIGNPLNEFDFKNFENEKKTKSKRETKNQTEEHVTYKNTYPLDPVYPLIESKVMQIIKNEIARLKEVSWTSPGHLCLELSNCIKNKLKVQKFSRYKYIVTTTFGDVLDQGFKIASLFFWDAQRDNYISETFFNSRHFITVCVYAVYFD